jgi:hypothetical protein
MRQKQWTKQLRYNILWQNIAAHKITHAQGTHIYCCSYSHTWIWHTSCYSVNLVMSFWSVAVLRYRLLHTTDFKQPHRKKASDGYRQKIQCCVLVGWIITQLLTFAIKLTPEFKMLCGDIHGNAIVGPMFPDKSTGSCYRQLLDTTLRSYLESMTLASHPW